MAGMLYLIVLIPSILHLVRSLLGDNLQIDLTTAVSALAVVLLVLIVYTIISVIVGIVSMPIIVGVAFILPFLAPFDSPLPPILDWWAFGSLAIIYMMFVAYYWSSITVLRQSIIRYVQGSTK